MKLYLDKDGAAKLIRGISGRIPSPYIEQAFTEEQKEQVRINTGAGTSNLVIGTTEDTAAPGEHTHGKEYYKKTIFS